MMWTIVAKTSDSMVCIGPLWLPVKRKQELWHWTKRWRTRTSNEL